MTESAEATTTAKNILVFQESQSDTFWILPVFACVCAVILAYEPSATGGGAVVGAFLLALVLALIATRQQTAEVDIGTRRLRIFRRFFGRWTRTLVDYPFEQCRQLGRTEYETEGHRSYGVYVELADGSRHAIPLTSSDFVAAGLVAAQISDATGIPKVDIKY